MFYGSINLQQLRHAPLTDPTKQFIFAIELVLSVLYNNLNISCYSFYLKKKLHLQIVFTTSGFLRDKSHRKHQFRMHRLD